MDQDGRGFGNRGRRVVLVLGLVLAGVGVVRGAGSVEVKRARPPQKWDRSTTSIFIDNALATLEGDRPTFGGRPATAPGGSGGSADEPDMPGPGGFKWSTLISEETLTDEVKEQKGVVTEATARPSDFKGGGYEKARVAFSSLALAFGVIAAYDGDIRWRKQSATARDLFARAGFNCKVGTDQSLAESKARLADLATLLEGGAPQARADRDEDFKWSQVAGRPALMKRLEEAEKRISPAASSKGDFQKQSAAALREAEIVAAIGEAIRQPAYEYHDDDSYRGHAAAMRDAAARLRAALHKGDYETGRTAIGELKKSCDACHGDFRG